jgi:hypothetical protein
MDLKEVYEMEYKIFQGFMDYSNCTEFFEGVRALLIDKDKNPKWRHSSVHDVSSDEIAYFFDRNE